MGRSCQVQGTMRRRRLYGDKLCERRSFHRNIELANLTGGEITLEGIAVGDLARRRN